MISTSNMDIYWTNKALKQFQYWEKTDRHKAKKIVILINAITKHPYEGIGKPESLKYMESDIWSRRIDHQHRLVYQRGKNSITILTCRYNNSK